MHWWSLSYRQTILLCVACSGLRLAPQFSTFTLVLVILLWYLKLFWTDILQHVPSKVPDIDCSWHFMVLYLGKILIISLYVITFPGRDFLMQVESPCLWLHHSIVWPSYQGIGRIFICPREIFQLQHFNTNALLHISHLICPLICCCYCASVYSNFSIIHTHKSCTILLQCSVL